MSIEQGLVAHLLADAGVSGIVGTRVYAELRPQKSVLPAIVYTRVGSTHENTLDGPSPFVTVRMQVDCWSSTYGGSKTLADAVRVALNGVGLSPPKLLGSEPVQLVSLDTDTDLSETVGDLREFRVSQDWLIIHLES